MPRILYSLLLLLLLLASQVSYAQQKKNPKKPPVPRQPLSTAHRPMPGEDAPPSPAYKAEAFLGTWEWHSGADVFRMTLRRDRFHRAPNGEQRHLILGIHSFSRNGVLLENPDTDALTQQYGFTMLGTPYADWEINMMLSDITKNKSGKALLTIDPDNPDQMEFTLRAMESISFALPGMPPPPPPGFTVPTHMTLTRVQ